MPCKNADQIRDVASNVLSSASAHALTGDELTDIHSDGVDPEPDALGDTKVYIDSVRPEITAVTLDKANGIYGYEDNLNLTVNFSELLDTVALSVINPTNAVNLVITRIYPDYDDPSDEKQHLHVYQKQCRRKHS